MVSYGILFPGQGSQFVGMGAELFDARDALLGRRSDEILGWSLEQMCLEGPEDELTRTEHAQPALFALSYAMWDILSESLDTGPSGAAGHSLGEYTALCAAGVIDYDSALETVAARGRAMAEAADRERSGMAALIGADLELARSVVERRESEGGRLELANINAPGQIVVAGGVDDIEWLSESSRDLGVRRVIPLKVAGAFHSSFMESAADEVGKALEELEFAQPEFPVWSNTTAKPHDVADVRHLLREQVVSTVRFSESLSGMADSGIDTFVHVGPGDVTAGMARRTVRDATVLVVSEIAEIDDAAGSLGTMA
jgi:[acyl-carrier-protein] S-malonyltransferase